MTDAGKHVLLPMNIVRDSNEDNNENNNNNEDNHCRYSRMNTCCRQSKRDDGAAKHRQITTPSGARRARRLNQTKGDPRLGTLRHARPPLCEQLATYKDPECRLLPLPFDHTFPH